MIDLPPRETLGKAIYLEACYQQDIAYMFDRHWDHYGTHRGYREIARRTWYRGGWSETIRRLYTLMDAVYDFADTSFECGEWNRNDSDEPWDRVYERSRKAEARLWEALAVLVPYLKPSSQENAA